MIINRNDRVSLMNLMKKLNMDEYDKKLKMKIGHHIKKLKNGNLIIEKTHGKQKNYTLTEAGDILGLIFSYFKF